MDLRSPAASSSTSTSHQPNTGRPLARAPSAGSRGAQVSRTGVAPRVPVTLGRGHQEEPPPEDSDDDDPSPTSLTCPFPECPSSTVTKSRKALVCHLAAKHVSHGQTVPEATLRRLNVRLCGDPCRTLVPAGARCRNCRAAPGPQGSAEAEPGVPMPMLPPPTCHRAPQAGTLTTGACPQLSPSFTEALCASAPTVRHIPAMCRSAVASELARLVRDVAVPVPTWEALHRLMCFPKLVLRSSGRGGRKHQKQAAHDMDKRLRLFHTGALDTLWAEAKAAASRQPQDYFLANYRE